MTDFIENTEWKISAKGNYWRRKKGVTLVVGGSSDKGYWVRIGDNFLPDWAESLEEAMLMADKGI